MTATTSTTDRPGLEELCTVMYDRDADRRASPAFAERYRAASDSVAGRVYDVRFYPESRSWTCNCPATVPCKHISRCARLRMLRWWSARLVECTTPELRKEQRRRQERVEAGQADADDHGCLDAIALRLDREHHQEAI